MLCVTISRLYRERHFKTFFEENKRDSKKVWEAINAIIIYNKNTQKITADKLIYKQYNYN